MNRLNKAPHIASSGLLEILGLNLNLEEVDTLLSAEFQRNLLQARREMAHGEWRKCRDPECDHSFWGSNAYCSDFCSECHTEAKAEGKAE